MIDKTLVTTMLSANCFRVHEPGVHVSPARFLHTVREVKPDVLGFSALPTTMLTKPEMIQPLETAGRRSLWRRPHD